MKFILEQHEIKQALTEYITNQGIDISGQDTDISILAGRGENGYSATISTSKPKTTKKKKATVTSVKDTAPKTLEQKDPTPASLDIGKDVEKEDNNKKEEASLSESEDESIFS